MEKERVKKVVASHCKAMREDSSTGAGAYDATATDRRAEAPPKKKWRN